MPANALTPDVYHLCQFPDHALDHVSPFPPLRLAKQPKTRIPGAVLAFHHPAPRRHQHGRQQHPDRYAKGTGQVHGGIGNGDDEIEGRHLGQVVRVEGRGRRIKLVVESVGDLRRRTVDPRRRRVERLDRD